MKKIKQSLQNLNLGEDRILNRKDLKLILGGFGGSLGEACSLEAPCNQGLACENEICVSAGPCLGCNTTSECAAVLKGTCEYCSQHYRKCCTGWHGH